jgi:hypothetical protein
MPSSASLYPLVLWRLAPQFVTLTPRSAQGVGGGDEA